jgi:hypothetical protein
MSRMPRNLGPGRAQTCPGLPKGKQMPRTPPLLLVCLLWALAAFAWPIGHHQTLAQDKPAPGAARSKAPVPPEVVVPPAESIVILIRSTLLRLDDALQTSNYTVLRDLAAPSFRDANSPGRLHEIFANLTAQRIDLSTVAILAPKLAQPPTIDQNRRLRISGHFPGERMQLNFDLTFEAVATRWRVFGISVNLAKSGGPAPNAVAPTDERKLPAQQSMPAR